MTEEGIRGLRGRLAKAGVPKVRFRMLLGNQDHARYSVMEPPVCERLYRRMFPEGISKRCVGTESDLAAWCRITGLDGWPEA